MGYASLSGDLARDVRHNLVYGVSFRPSSFRFDSLHHSGTESTKRTWAA